MPILFVRGVLGLCVSGVSESPAEPDSGFLRVPLG